jgi:hypothetical protein
MIACRDGLARSSIKNGPARRARRPEFGKRRTVRVGCEPSRDQGAKLNNVGAAPGVLQHVGAHPQTRCLLLRLTRCRACRSTMTRAHSSTSLSASKSSWSSIVTLALGLRLRSLRPPSQRRPSQRRAVLRRVRMRCGHNGGREIAKIAAAGAVQKRRSVCYRTMTARIEQVG